MAFDSLKKLYNKFSGKTAKAKQSEVTPAMAPIASEVAKQTAVASEVVLPPRFSRTTPTVHPDDIALLITQLQAALATGLGTTSEERSGLLSYIKRALSGMGLPSWDRHHWETLKTVSNMAADLLSDIEYLKPWVEYYAVKLGFRSTETLMMIITKHAVVDSFSAVIHDAKE